MATIFDNIILDEIENSKISFLPLVRLLKERINQNAKRKLYAIVERERDNGAVGKKGRARHYRTNHCHCLCICTLTMSKEKKI